MAIGKTSSSISKTEVFSRFTEAQILSAVFPEVKMLPCKISSPLRKDEHPSFGLYLSNNGHIYYKDYANMDERGSLLDLLCKYWNCNFNQCLERICQLMMSEDNVTIRPKQIKTFTRKETDQQTEIQVAVRPWKDYDYEYWHSYGIEKQWLRYAEIYPISHKIVTKKNKETGSQSKYIFPADKLAYAFIERKEGKLQIKIYQPYNTKGYKWCSKMDHSVIGLWAKIPQQGDRVVICSSMKDALCLSCQCHIPTLCLQGEGYNMSDTAISELKRRYKKVFICFDTDLAGIIDGQKLAEKTGFINVVPDLGMEKDLSDYYKNLQDKQQFKQLEELFH